MNTVFLRTDVLDSLTNLLLQAACKTIEDAQTNEDFVDFLVKVAKSKKEPKVKKEAKPNGEKIEPD